jgi:hypothetical protein
VPKGNPSRIPRIIIQLLIFSGHGVLLLIIFSIELTIYIYLLNFLSIDKDYNAPGKTLLFPNCSSKKPRHSQFNDEIWLAVKITRLVSLILMVVGALINQATSRKILGHHRQ